MIVVRGVEVVGTPLLGSTFLAENDDNAVLTLVRAGRKADDAANTTGREMPESGGNPALTDAEILAIVAHIRTFETGGG